MNLADFYEGLAKHLHEAGHANHRGLPNPTPGKPPIYFKGMPTEPHEALVITVYGINEAVGIHLQDLQVQIRARGTATDSLGCDTILDPLKSDLHGATYVSIVPGHKFRLIAHKSTVPMGQDGNGRHERADNYTFFGQRS